MTLPWKINKHPFLTTLLCGVILLLPFYTVRFAVAGIPFSLPEVVLWAAVVVWVTIFRKRDSIFFTRHRIILLIMGVLTAGALLSTFFSQDVRAGLGVVKAWFAAPMIFALMVVWLSEKKSQKEQNTSQLFFATYFYSAVGVALTALGYFFSGTLTYDGRLEAFYSSPNMLALYCAPAVFYITTLLFSKKGEKFFTCSILLHLCAAVILLITIYLTQSYAAWGAILFAALIIFFMCCGRKNAVHGVFLIVFFLGVLFATQFHNDKIQNLITQFERSSLSSRIMIWKSAGHIISDYPLVGIGPNQFQQHYLNYQKYYPPYLEWAVPQPHNIYLAFYVQAGLLGFIAFIALCLYIGKKVFLAQQKTPLLLAVGGAFLVILFHGFLDTPYWKTDLAFVFWLVVATTYYNSMR